ncbi:MAG: alanine racemase, partial [Clostridia bacterium]|nr:alanine racemase [Clostridia bacterium]
MIRKAAGDAECMCIVKADAYGHGAIPVARQLFDCGARFFAVS